MCDECYRAINTIAEMLDNLNPNDPAPLDIDTDDLQDICDNAQVAHNKQTPKPHNPTARELATVLAALRCAIRVWQNDQPGHDGENYLRIHDIVTDGGTLSPMLKSDIDDLCQRLNC